VGENARVTSKHREAARAFPLALHDSVAQELANKERDERENPKPVALSQADVELLAASLDARAKELTASHDTRAKDLDERERQLLVKIADFETKSRAAQNWTAPV
jgi:hypothetical protein